MNSFVLSSNVLTDLSLHMDHQVQEKGNLIPKTEEISVLTGYRPEHDAKLIRQQGH